MTSAINGPVRSWFCLGRTAAEGFTDIFTSRWVQLDDPRLHAVTGPLVAARVSRGKSQWYPVAIRAIVSRDNTASLLQEPAS